MPTDTPMKRYRTRVPKPDAQFYDMTLAQVQRLFIERCDQSCYSAVPDKDDVVLTFEAPDLYELATMVRDLQDELQSEGFHYHLLHIERPKPVLSRQVA